MHILEGTFVGILVMAVTEVTCSVGDDPTNAESYVQSLTATVRPRQTQVTLPASKPNDTVTRGNAINKPRNGTESHRGRMITTETSTNVTNIIINNAIIIESGMNSTDTSTTITTESGTITTESGTITTDPPTTIRRESRGPTVSEVYATDTETPDMTMRETPATTIIEPPITITTTPYVDTTTTTPPVNTTTTTPPVNATTTTPPVNTTTTTPPVNTTTTTPPVNTTTTTPPVNTTTTTPPVNTTTTTPPVNTTTTTPPANTTTTTSPVNTTTTTPPVNTTTTTPPVNTTTTTPPVNTTTTTSPVNTTTTTPPTSTPSPDDPYTPDLSDKTYKIPMALSIIQEFHDSLRDKTNDNFIRLKTEIEKTVSDIFLGTPEEPPGFSEAVVHNFLPESDWPIVKQTELFTVRRASNIDNVVANYTIEYYMTQLITEADVDDLFNFLVGPFETALNVTMINGSSLDSAFLDEYSEYLSTTIRDNMTDSVANPCTADDEICDVCYDCGGNSTANHSLSCTPRCTDSKHEMCTVSASGPIHCTCKNKYLIIGENCVHQSKLIAVTCSLVGALIVGMIIGLAVMGTQKKKKKHHDKPHEGVIDIESLGRIESKGHLESAGVDNRGFESSLGVDLDDVPLDNLEHQNITTFKPESNEPESEHHYTTDPMQYDTEPGPSYFSDITNPTYTKLLDQTEYKNFQASLEHIDPNTDYFAARPQIKLRDSSRNQYI